jgi:hypothetical protein
MNYQIITDEKMVKDFINFLPELGKTETFFLALFARKKYTTDPNITNGQSVMKRFISNKKNLFEKIKQLECPIGAYTVNGHTVPQECLTLHININPRCQNLAAQAVAKHIIDCQFKSPNELINLNNLTLSNIQNHGKKKKFFDFEFDVDNVDTTIQQVLKIINKDCLKFLRTRGGVHCLVEIEKVSKQFKNTWYKSFQEIPGCDTKAGNDKTLPMPGTYQGGFTPHFLDI